MTAPGSLASGAAVTVAIPVAWGDMDAFGHVNNTVYLRWFETARIAWLEAVDWPDDRGPVLSCTAARFRVPVTYPATVFASVWASELDDEGVTHHYRVSMARRDPSAPDGAPPVEVLVATGEARLVAFDLAAGAKALLPADAAARVAASIARQANTPDDRRPCGARPERPAAAQSGG